MSLENFTINTNKQESYSLPDENIISLDANSKLLNKLPESLKKLPWPMEIQGYCHTDKDKKEITIRYPEGDLFLSFLVTVHELGHLNQSEIFPELHPERQINDYDGANLNKIREKDAWGRGVKRLKEFAPEALDEMREKFLEYKNNGKFRKFDNFDDYISSLVHIFDKISDFYIDYYKGEDQKEKNEDSATFVAERIKRSDVYDFFENIEEYRCGDKIDKQFIFNYIKTISNKVLSENENS